MSEKEESYYINQIDAYLDGKLSRIDKDQFDKAVNEDASLKEKIEAHIISRSLIRNYGENELKSKFKNALKTEVDNPVIKKRSPLPYLLFLLGLAILFLLALKIYKRSVSDSSSKTEPIALSSVEDPSYTLFRSQADTLITTNWKSAVKSFVNKDYSKSLMLLDSLDSNVQFVNDHSGKLALMKGVSYLKTEDYTNAEKTLLTIKEGNPYYDQVEWYLALTSYYSSDLSNAKLRFSKISKDLLHYKNEAASNYLKSIE